MNRIGQDYIWLDKRPRRRPSLRWLGFVVATPLVAGGIGMSTQSGGGAEASRGTAVKEVGIPLKSAAGRHGDGSLVTLHEPERFSVAPSAPESDTPQTEWIEVEIGRGDTLSLAFQRHDLAYRDALAIARLEEHGNRLSRGLKAGDTLYVHADDAGHVLALNYPLDPIHTLEVRKSGDGYAAGIALTDVERRQAYTVGVIDTSFYIDALEAGLSDKLIMNLSRIFGWDIDFVLDTRPGDRFIVVYEELYHDGEKIGDGHILAAEFNNRGRQLRALRYTDADDNTAYYTPNGDAMKKAFIRTPLDQFRISSHFSQGRKHPILNRIRRHAGTDYAAPTGTPIKATGDGRVVFRGRKGGYGNTVIIKHNNRYSTRYAHMSRFASGLGIGSYVRQGQTIGFVGMTGLATGPHLHYEFRVHGEPRDPQTVDLPEAAPLPEKYLADFRRRVQPLLAQIDALSRVQVAYNSTR